MTSYSDRGVKPDKGEFLGFDHIHFWVGNAYQAAAYYVCRFGFEPYAFRGLETGSRSVMTQVVRQNDVIFAFSSPLEPHNTRMSDHTMTHGDGVKEIAFNVNNCAAIFDRAVAAGAVVVRSPNTVFDGDEVGDGGENGCVIATIEAPYKDTWHTFIERRKFSGTFLPGFVGVVDHDPQVDLVEPVGLQFIDHCVANQEDGAMEPVVEWYVKKLSFHRYWSVDDSQLHTDYSSLRSIVIADYDERIKMPINEPADGLRKSQIQEFVEYYGGPGVQHIALNTNNIIRAVTNLRRRGVSFIRIPDAYYDDLRERLRASSTIVQEDVTKLQKLGILVDFDDGGYLLQIFTKPIQDRPTVFLEIIQRSSHQGFGVGNFKSLFEAIEREQGKRGNL